ncbi:MAG TPA: acetylxylan esterase [Capsulimonadaceae bacterium]|jgi:cephalosporin-C deacetylase
MTTQLDHPYDFDPAYGHDLDDLLAVGAPEGPADLDAFWQATYAASFVQPLNIASRKIELPAADGVDVYEVEYDSWDDIRIGAWMTVPKNGDIRWRLVCGHGYGGRDAPDFGPLYATSAAIFPCMRGEGRSLTPRVPEAPPEHVLHGIETVDGYVLRGCVVDTWRAASVLLELVGGDSPLGYVGGSFGGGLGAMSLAWDSRFERGFLSVPTFGNHPLRVTMPCVGSGEAVRIYHQTRPEVMDVLQYYDAAIIARRVTVPVLSACALFDPAVPPPGQFAVHNSLGGEKELFVLPAGHFEAPDSPAAGIALDAAILKWFA